MSIRLIQYFDNFDRYRADVQLRAGKLDQALIDVKKAMELDSTSGSLYRSSTSMTTVQVLRIP